ncbi:MAG: DNA polymerase I [Acidobacteriota bacterium]
MSTDSPQTDSSQTNSSQTDSSPRPRLYLVDGYSNIFRAYYAIRNLSNSRGEPTNAAFGFLQMLRKLLRDEAPEHLGIAMDVSSATVRKERYEDYKAHRKPMPEDLRPQIAWIREIVEAYRIPLLEMERYEADDVLGTLAKKATAAGYDVILVSPDKDLFQLVDEHVFVLHTGRDKLYDAKGVEEDFGVPPAQVVDVLALMGDSSDNVPGVPGIGAKGAVKLLEQHGSLDALLDAADSVKRKSYREGLQTHRDDALLSKELVTIHTDLDIAFEPATLTVDEPDLDQLLELCWRLDFQQIARELEETHGGRAPELAPAECVQSADELAAALAPTLNDGGDLGVAVLGVGTPGSEALGLVFARPTADNGDEEGEGEGEHTIFADFRDAVLRTAALEQLRALVARADVRLVGHDLKEALRLLGPRCDVGCRLVDTMLLSYVTRSALRSHDFEAVVMDRLHRTPSSAKDAGFTKEGLPMPGASSLAIHAAERAVLPLRMVGRMEEDLDAPSSGGQSAEEGGDDGSLRAVYERFEEPLVSLLATMEEAGILLDTDFLAVMSDELASELAALERAIYEIAGETFNLNSPKQLGEIMFEKLGYPVVRKTRKSKSYSTDAETLENLAARGFDLPEQLLRWRELAKLKSTYVDALPQLVDDGGRIHTRFNQAVAATGRLSSSDPNLQNIPVRTELGQRLRDAFRAPEGYSLIVADYSQIELRILAHIAEEETMIEAFRRGEDIHAATAAAVFGISSQLVVPEQRRVAKMINFGIVYGMTAFGLATRLGIGRGDAKRFIDTYMERYPGVQRYTEETLDEAFETGRVTTLYGRVRQIPDIRSRNWNLRENSKRMAINAPIQGTAADLLKDAMLAVESTIRAEEPSARLLLTVHDELVLEAPSGVAEALAQSVKEAMEGVATLRAPLVVDLGLGATWGAAKS